MKILLIVLVLWGGNNPVDIAKINRLKKEAEKAYTSGDFQLAAQKYSTLYDSMEVDEDEIALNLAHSYYNLQDTSKARPTYEKLTTSSNNALKSIAYQQLGVMAKNPKTLKQSLAYLKSALKADPTNEGARYDYEVVKKLLKEQQEQEKNEDQENKQNQDEDKQDQDKQDQKEQDSDKQDQDQKDQNEEQNQENEDQEQNDQEQKDSEKQDGEQGEQDESKNEEQQQGEENDEDQEQENQDMSTQQKLEEMNISEEKAQMILEAMKNNEIQYIQQQKRKSTKSPESDKPDW